MTTKASGAKSMATNKRVAKKTDKNVERSRLAKLNDWFVAHKKVGLALWALGIATWVGLVLFCVQWLLVFIFRAILPDEILTTNWFNGLYSFICYGICIVVTVILPWDRILLNKKLVGIVAFCAHWPLLIIVRMGVLRSIPDLSPLVATLCASLLYVVTALVIIVGGRLFGKSRTKRDELGLHGLPTWTDVLLSPIGLIVSLIAGAVLTALLMLIMPQVDWQQTQDVGFSGLYALGDYMVAFICIVVLAPVAEEIMFRGWLYGKLRGRLSAVPAILITSALFGIMHGQMNVGVVVFAMSVVMCISRELTGTIWAGILIHMIKNGLAFYYLFRM